MMDPPDRATARFPASMESRAAEEIAKALDELGVQEDDLALSQAAAGGDILFLEACRARKVHTRILLPYPEPDFIQRSVMPSDHGERWRDRFYDCRNAAEEVRIMPEELGPTPEGVNPYERCNLWLLFTALAMGVDKVHFMCLWNGAEGTGPGGTAHMYEEVKNRTGRVTWIDTRAV